MCLSQAQIGLLYGSQKAWATPRWSPLGVKFKISDERPRLFHMGAPPPPPRGHTPVVQKGFIESEPLRLQGRT